MLMDGKMVSAPYYMRNAHSKYVHEMNMGDKEFDITTGHLVSTMQDFKVPEGLIGEVGPR
jgi:hypothetical protein